MSPDSLAQSDLLQTPGTRHKLKSGVDRGAIKVRGNMKQTYIGFPSTRGKVYALRGVGVYSYHPERAVVPV
ncbi:hypothetical protein ANO14919_048110 [Xylariales sp. No.14919]|nr:hypothetical protein ANO14919_048110 [Xylariales sp. No.14919]